MTDLKAEALAKTHIVQVVDDSTGEILGILDSECRGRPFFDVVREYAGDRESVRVEWVLRT